LATPLQQSAAALMARLSSARTRSSVLGGLPGDPAGLSADQHTRGADDPAELTLQVEHSLGAVTRKRVLTWGIPTQMTEEHYIIRKSLAVSRQHASSSQGCVASFRCIPNDRTLGMYVTWSIVQSVTTANPCVY